MLIKNPKFEISAVSPKQYPTNNLPEIVLVGKSNVGKSSFVNSMINRKSLARTSNTPGKTRQLNFYNMDNLFYFVDLPGYGYSKMSKEEEKKVAASIEQYLFSRENISLIVLLLDIRHKPTENDKLMYNYIKNANSNFLILANKADKFAKTKVMDNVNIIKEALELPDEIDILPFSSENKIYCESVWEKIGSILGI